MPVIFHPPVEQIKANFFGPVTPSNRRFIRILEKLGDGFEVYYQPCIGDDRPDFAVVRLGRGIQFIKTCEFDLSDLTVPKNSNGNYKKTTSSNNYLSPFTSIFDSKNKLSEFTLFPIFRLENPKLSNHDIVNVRRDFFAGVSTSVYFASSLENVLCLYQGSRYQIDSNAPFKRFETHHVFWTKEDSDDLILSQLQLNFSGRKELFTENIQKAIQHRFLSLDRDDENSSAVQLQGKQAQLAKSTPGEWHRIKGAAGSGKTTVLASRAINSYVLTKERVLILYYNITLGSYLQSKIFRQNRTIGFSFSPDALNNCFEFATYNSFLYKQARLLGIKDAYVSKDVEMTDREWEANEHQLIDKIRESMANRELAGDVDNFRYKTILIDELQDFSYDKKNPAWSWIRLIEDCFLKENGELVVFADASQNLYGRSVDKDKHPYTPGFLGSWNTLTANYRLSTATADIAQKFQKRFFEKDAFDEIALISKKTRLGGFGFADPKAHGHNYSPAFFLRCLRWFVSQYNICLNDICVMAEDKETLRLLDLVVAKHFPDFRPVLRSFETEKEYQLATEQAHAKFITMRRKHPTLVWNPESRETKKQIEQYARDYNRHQKTLFMINHPHMNALKLSTIHSFKGQESSTVILLLTNALMKSAHSASLIYTALSRAKQNLVVFDATDASPANPWYPTYEQYKHFFKEMDTYFKNT